MLSPSPSSSAVTIPTPGKSILKRPPPQPQSFFSRFTKLLPTQASVPTTANDEAKTLKRAHFILPEMTTVYPISSANPPSTPTLKEEKKSIEEREAERRRRVVRRNSSATISSMASVEESWWSLEQVESFYRECCVGREENPDPAISAAFLVRLPFEYLSSIVLNEYQARQAHTSPHCRFVWRTIDHRVCLGPIRCLYYRMGSP